MHNTRTYVMQIAFMIAAAFPATSSAVEYKCKGKNGEWSAANCTGSAAPIESQEARAMREVREDKDSRDARFDAYSKICFAEGYTGTDCQFKKMDDYDVMTSYEHDSGLSSADRTKLVTCKRQCYNETAKVVDGSMWRYCYYH